MVNPVLEVQLHEQMDRLLAGEQRQVLDFARALVAARPRGVAGRDLLPLAGAIDATDLAAIAAAVAECGQADTHGW